MSVSDFGGAKHDLRPVTGVVNTLTLTSDDDGSIWATPAIAGLTDTTVAVVGSVATVTIGDEATGSTWVITSAGRPIIAGLVDWRDVDEPGASDVHSVAVTTGARTVTVSVIGGSSGGGSGDMLAANNLSDVADASTSRDNLGLGDSAVADVGTGAGEVAAGNHAHSAYEAGLTALGATVAQADTDINALEGGMTALGAAHSALDSEVDDLTGTVDNLSDSVDALGAAVDVSEMQTLEAFTKAALVGGGSLYDGDGFELASQGDFDDGGFDIFTRSLAMWDGNRASGAAWNYGEDFSIPDASFGGGDLIEFAVCWDGDKTFPFFEFVADGESTEDPRIHVTDFRTPMWVWVENRFTHDGDTGVSKYWRRALASETAEETAHGLGWMVHHTTDRGEAWPIETGVTEPWTVGKGYGRRLINRVIVNQFDGTAMADFDPVSNTVDASTVSDPVAGSNWVSGGTATIVETANMAANLFAAPSSGGETQPVGSMVLITCWDTPDASSGSLTLTNSSSYGNSGSRQGAVSTAANDIVYERYLTAGTWHATLTHVSNASFFGKATLSVGGVTSAAIDMDGGNSNADQAERTFVIPTSGVQTIRLESAVGDSSGRYSVSLSDLVFVRTA